MGTHGFTSKNQSTVTYFSRNLMLFGLMIAMIFSSQHPVYEDGNASRNPSLQPKTGTDFIFGGGVSLTAALHAILYLF